MTDDDNIYASDNAATPGNVLPEKKITPLKINMENKAYCQLFQNKFQKLLNTIFKVPQNKSISAAQKF